MNMRVKGIWIRGKGGAALVTAIVFVFFLTLFGLAFYRLGETDIDLFTHQKNLSKSLYASEAGLDKVRWILRESDKIAEANPSKDPNPFSSTYVEADALAIANPPGFFPWEEDKAYFKITEITAELLPTGLPGSRVKVQAFGSVDVDADGEPGLTPIGGGKFDPDPDDVNRKFEAFISLPGSLSENVSAAARAFSGKSGPFSESRDFVTPDGDSLNGFLYFGSPPSPWGIWDRWEFIFSNPVITGDVELPPGIFDTNGEYIDDDTDGIPDYFQDLDLRVYSGDQTFRPANDPTAGADGRAVIYVNGNITIENVDFGHLNDNDPWEVRNSDWEGYPPGRFDLTFIANGDITVNGVDCGNVGRLVLVAKDIIFKGDYDTKVNAIAIASDDITLGSSCQYGILTPQNPSDYDRPVMYAAYFLGSMVAGDLIQLQDDGWAVIYDENVINGYMYSTAVSKPTLTYERVEAEDFNSSNNWRSNESTPELLHRQGIYTQDEIDTMQGDYADGGADTLPEVMRVYTNRNRWRPKAVAGVERWAIGETLRLDFLNGDFEDPHIPDRSLQNWDYYDTLTFWMTLDNFTRTNTDGTKTTRREARYQIRLRDAGGNTISIPLDTLYPVSEWGTVRYHHMPGGGLPEEYTEEIRDLTAGEKANGEAYSNWKRIKITTKDIDPGISFDVRNVEEFDIRYVDMTVSWTVDPAKQDARVIWYDGGYFRYYDENGDWESIDEKKREGDLYNDPPAASDGYYYLYDDSTPLYVKWIEDPDSPTDVRMREEVLMPTLRIDRLELPGKPATNNHLEYGLPHCLRLEITNWHELQG
jgi:hypothetical protein